MARNPQFAVKISADNFKLDRYLKQALPGHIKSATQMALNDVAKTIKVQAAKEIAPALKIKSSLIKQRFGLFYGKKYRGAVGVYFHFAPMPAFTTAGKTTGGRFVPGKVNQPKRGGVKAGGRTFKDGFVGRTRKGPRRGKLEIYKKDASAKHGVRRILVSLDSQKDTIIKVGDRVRRQRLEDYFHRRLRAKVKGYL